MPDINAIALAAAQSAAASASSAATSAEYAADAIAADLGTSDGQTVALISDPESQTAVALSATIGRTTTGANISRFITRAQSGENLTITVLGDSMWAGQTVTNPATDGAAILLANDLSARFPGTVTVTNRAAGGRTMLTMHTFQDVEFALADKADLYIIGGGRNDAMHTFSGGGGDYKAGYPLAGSTAARERVIRLIRERVPKADLMLTSEQPYRASTGGSTNPLIRTYYDAAERLAAEYGAEWVDVYDAAQALGDYDSLVHTDGVHPNTAGHRFMADVVLARIPADYAGPVLSPLTPGALATRKPGEVDTSQARLGYVVAAAVSQPGLSFTKGGTGWTGTAPHVTSTAADYIEYAFTGTELHVNLTNTDAGSPVVFNVAVDGATVATNVAPAVQGIAYYHPMAQGLTATPHTVRVTLVSGTLKVNQGAALVGPGTDYKVGVKTVVLSDVTTNTALSTAGSATSLASGMSIPLPAGWAMMDVHLVMEMRLNVAGETTSTRSFQASLRYTTGGAFTIRRSWYHAAPAVAAGGSWFNTQTLHWQELGCTQSQTFNLDAYAQGTDKTGQSISDRRIVAVCYRTA